MAVEKKISIEFPVIEIVQPIGSFFVGSISAKDLCRITRFDIRRILREREIETWLGIQRPLNKKRVAELQQYVNTVDATFPTGVIVAVDQRCVELDEKMKTMTLSNYMDVEETEEPIYFEYIAKVLDGQHRIEGLKNYDGSDFQVNVSIFVDADIATQANIFSTVNLAQTKVNKSLAYDLFALANTRSPQKTCHNIAVALDGNEGSPFFGRIKRLGRATEGRVGELVTQAAFVEALIKYISTNPMIDRDILLRGKSISRATSDESQKLIFRNMFIDEDDVAIGNVVWNFFDAVKFRWPKAWASQGRGEMLPRNSGLRGLMRFLRNAYLQFAAPGEVVEQEQFLRLLKKSSLTDDDFNTDNYPPGSTGEGKLFNDLRDQCRI